MNTNTTHLKHRAQHSPPYEIPHYPLTAQEPHEIADIRVDEGVHGVVHANREQRLDEEAGEDKGEGDGAPEDVGGHGLGAQEEGQGGEGAAAARLGEEVE